MGGWNRFGPAGDAEQLRITQSLWPVADYRNRKGYQADFIPNQPSLALPGAGKWVGDLVEVNQDARVTNRPDHEIAYWHFSVVMSKSRALPIFSAVNIDGKQSDRAVERTDIWRRDPRIPLNLQNLSESYGNQKQGFFARGHMTRREDPNWGDRQIAEQADADTFHITNVCQQVQSFNAGMWLALESYVLDSADTEDMRISVITGPVLTDQDPVYYNRKVPLEFFKIVVFVDSRSKQLAAIGYRRSQAQQLVSISGNKFVFGDFQDCQVPISGIASDTGLVLDDYVAIDVMEGADPRMAVRLASMSDLYLSR